MNPDAPFRVKPVKRYRGARYGSESPENFVGYAAWLAWRFPKALVKGAITLLLAAGLTLGMPACDDDTDTTSDGDSCEPDEIVCLDDETLKLCNNGSFETVACYEYCDREYGIEYGWNDCNVDDADNPCGCEYDLSEGEPVECRMGDLMCDGEYLLSCDYSYWVYTDCNDYCVENLGEDYCSYGCNAADAANPCLCDYFNEDGDRDRESDADTELDGDSDGDRDRDLDADADTELDGDSDGDLDADTDADTDSDADVCEPGAMRCADKYTLEQCGDAGWEKTSCYELCETQYGGDYVSSSCDAENTDDPCNCYYAIADGDIAECYPEDLSCNDAGQLEGCEWLYDNLTCEQFCRIFFGDASVPTACTGDDSDNVCGCHDPAAEKSNAVGTAGGDINRPDD